MTRKLIIPPEEPLDEIFNGDVIDRLKNKKESSESVSFRLNVLTASGPDTTNEQALWNVPMFRAYRAAWDTYLYAAFASGLFEGSEGVELRGRLTCLDDHGFRSAMAECIACWVFCGKFKMGIVPRPLGQKGKKLEFIAKSQCQNLHIEVKSPYRKKPDRGWSGDDSDLIKNCLKESAKQFQKGKCNILVLVPSLRTPVYACRGQLIKAFYGEERFVIDINTEKGCADSPARLEFFSEGKFLKKWKPEGIPRFKRVSAVLTVEETLRSNRDIIRSYRFLLGWRNNKFR